jgi:uncharacterized protein
MKPGDHPDFFRLAPPPGASRQSTLVLDREGRFWHDGALVEHAALEEALHHWITRHPDDGQLILSNGYDWCYFRAEDTPYFVRALRVEGEGQHAVMILSDGSEEPVDPRALSVGEDGAVYTQVKAGAFEARFSRHAQAALMPLLMSDDPPTVRVGDVEAALPARQR